MLAFTRPTEGSREQQGSSPNGSKVQRKRSWSCERRSRSVDLMPTLTELQTTMLKSCNMTPMHDLPKHAQLVEGNPTFAPNSAVTWQAEMKGTLMRNATANKPERDGLEPANKAEMALIQQMPFTCQPLYFLRCESILFIFQPFAPLVGKCHKMLVTRQALVTQASMTAGNVGPKAMAFKRGTSCKIQHYRLSWFPGVHNAA